MHWFSLDVLVFLSREYMLDICCEQLGLGVPCLATSEYVLLLMLLGPLDNNTTGLLITVATDWLEYLTSAASAVELRLGNPLDCTISKALESGAESGPRGVSIGDSDGASDPYCANAHTNASKARAVTGSHSSSESEI